MDLLLNKRLHGTLKHNAKKKKTIELTCSWVVDAINHKKKMKLMFTTNLGSLGFHQHENRGGNCASGSHISQKVYQTITIRPKTISTNKINKKAIKSLKCQNYLAAPPMPTHPYPLLFTPLSYAQFTSLLSSFFSKFIYFKIVINKYSFFF